DELETIFTTALVGSGLPLQHVFGYLPKEFVANGKKIHFALAIGSLGSAPIEEENKEDAYIVFDFILVTNILYSLDESNWTEENSQDRLDLVDKMITDALRDNSVRFSKEFYRQPSTVDLVGEEGGLSYWFETIPLKVRIYRSC
ncbi:MAG: hypothetical protein DSY80_10610, partial [Desulfocapsa sp.]